MNKKYAIFYLFILAALLLPGCAKKQPQAVAGADDFVAATLGQAAEQAHSELALVARLRGQGLQPLLPPPDPALSVPVSVSWTGEASGALKEICLQTGYRYLEAGSPSAQSLPVEDIAWQIQPQCLVRVDPVNRVLKLARTTGAAQK